MNIDSKLTGTITLTTVGTMNKYGELITGTTVTSIPCYIDGTRKRFVRGNNEIITADIYCLITSSINVIMGSKVYNGTDSVGNVLIPEGTVVQVTPLVHTRRGLLARELYITSG